MRITRDEHEVDIDGVKVTVTGRTGVVHATWSLSVNGVEVDSQKASGDFKLRGTLPDGTAVEAAVHQSLIGPTRVEVRKGGESVANFKGFVA